MFMFFFILHILSTFLCRVSFLWLSSFSIFHEAWENYMCKLYIEQTVVTLTSSIFRRKKRMCKCIASVKNIIKVIFFTCSAVTLVADAVQWTKYEQLFCRRSLILSCFTGSFRVVAPCFFLRLFHHLYLAFLSLFTSRQI